MSILEGDLASEVAARLEAERIPYGVTVVRTEEGPPDPETPWLPGPTIDVPYSARGWVDTYTADEIDGTLILSTDVKVIVLMQTLAIVPAPGDDVTVRGSTYGVISVQTDPALATAALQVRA